MRRFLSKSSQQAGRPIWNAGRSLGDQLEWLERPRGRPPAVESGRGPSAGRGERPGAVHRPLRAAWGRPPAVETGLGPSAGHGERPAIPNQQAFKAGLAGLRGLRLSLKTLWWSWRWRWRWKRTHWTPIWPLQWPKKSQPPLEGKIFIVHPFNGPRYGFSPPKNNYVRNIYRIFSITLWTYKNY